MMRMHLFVFDLQKGKRRTEFYQRLFGRTVISKGKRYRYEGLLNNVKGWRWATRSALLVPAREARWVRELFEEFGNVEFEEFVVLEAR